MYVINILEYGFQDNCGLYCGSHRIIDDCKKIPVTTRWSAQKPKIYKTKTGAKKSVKLLQKAYGVTCRIEEYQVDYTSKYISLFEQINNK